MTRAEQSLSVLGDQLHQLGAALSAADAPLVAIGESTDSATSEATSAATPVATVTDTLALSNEKAQTLSALLDDSLSLGQNIDSKLRIAFVLPKIEIGN